jgi:hypothetical protein
MKKYIFLVLFFCFTTQGRLLAQKLDSIYLFSNTCHWDSIGGNKTNYLKNKKGFIYNRFGTTIININSVAYNPCNLPLNLIGKKVLLSGIVFKNIKADGKAIRLTELQVVSDD